MRKLLICILILCSVTTYAQNGITFEVEKLSKPEKPLKTVSYEDIYPSLILSDTGLSPDDLKKKNINVPYNILAKSKAPDQLVNYDYNSFFYGMYEAYADHRPFILSPDMIWLLISQGFTKHVKANQESMRKFFVDFKGKISLIVESGKPLSDPTIAWGEILPKFTDQIRQHTGDELVELLSCNFSTTTSVEKIASEITIMETVKPYFEFIVIYVGCGIPEITLEGTPEDWEKVLDKAMKLKKYNLKWWISELEPLLQEFVKASKGDINKNFWRSMFKYHSQEKYGAPNIIDGWIVKFFPYDNKDKRNNLKQLEGGKNLPNEIVKVDIKFVEPYNDSIIETQLELWSGFIGLEQNTDNFALRPQIGWMVRKKDINDSGLKDKLRIEAQKDGFGFGNGISLRVKEFPSILLKFENIKNLQLKFTDKIDIPDELSKVKIGKLDLSGTITQEGIERIKQLFPTSIIRINDAMVQGELGSSFKSN
ncbi:DUF4419 domain-containing protein [Bacteroides sp.]|uniref:DUF4419 domain-containing protein n=1 Tax=Bacteroides sp. TaxID=29523 RepID=UPI00261C79AD|nr:DUF4419 domain-containing protein [Bacteroides sp.]MDD3036736.1 DUF4419 domain-containing protein [Bacteroides sp.]